VELLQRVWGLGLRPLALAKCHQVIAATERHPGCSLPLLHPLVVNEPLQQPMAAVFEAKAACGEAISMREVSSMDTSIMDATLGSSKYIGRSRGEVTSSDIDTASHSSSTSASHSSCPSPESNGTKRYADGTEKSFGLDSGLDSGLDRHQLEEELEDFAIDHDLDELASWWKVSSADIKC
jgi:hypothetical protein|tara:strand:+ start:538 stop:1077 length:540 start_codon:yes stop_codon:yes gene_type:complete